ncbi:MAG: hypothetical protein H0W12_06830 [Chitinophagaceae bacterium]|nr:hypothetical protein [Chitinophagaceae bacterium]
MYNHIWKKYLPFIKIQLKKSAAGEQVFALNRVDFERAGTGRKAGYKFMIELTNGRVSNVISGSPLAMNLAAVMLEDDATKQILQNNTYEISLNTKFQLTTKNSTPAKETVAEEEVEKEEVVEDKIATEV